MNIVEMIEQIQPGEKGLNKKGKNYIIYLPENAKYIEINQFGRCLELSCEQVPQRDWQIVSHLCNETDLMRQLEEWHPEPYKE